MGALSFQTQGAQSDPVARDVRRYLMGCDRTPAGVSSSGRSCTLQDDLE